MLRVLQCVAGMNRGGIETLLMNLYRSIDKEQLQFDFLVGLDGVYDAEIRALGGKIYKVPFITQAGPFCYAAGVDAVFKAHPEYKIVHCHMDKFNGMVLKIAKKNGVPVRVSHSHSTKNEGGVAFQLVKNHYGRMVLPNATDLFACGEDAAVWLYGKRAGECVMLKNGVVLDRFSPRDSRTPGGFAVGCVARFTEIKNHSFLFRVFAEIRKAEPGARLLLAGDGPLRAQLEAEAKALHLGDAVEFLGVRSDVEHVLEQLDVLCMPSLFEGLPVSLIEAQAAGVPCVVSDTVAAESNVTGAVEFLSLHQPETVWAKALLSHKGGPRLQNTELLRQKGYDIKTSADQLTCFYQKAALRGKTGEL